MILPIFLCYLASPLVLLDSAQVCAFQGQWRSHPSELFAIRKKYATSLRSNTAFKSRIKVSSSAAATADDTYTVQILMSDTGGGHRASANALRDAFDVLYPGKIQCDIVDIYTQYGPFWPFNDYVALYKIMAEYPFLWDWFYHFGATPFGLWLNEVMLETFCFAPFKECINRPSGDTNARADMVVSVHPLCQDIPLKILAYLDSNGKTRNPLQARTTPFATVVTDLGGAHPTWFNMAVDKCFVPSDELYQLALARDLRPEQIIQHGLPIRKGFWGMNDDIASAFSLSTSSGVKDAKDVIAEDFFGDLVRTVTGGGNKKGAKKYTQDKASSEKLTFRKKLGLKSDSPAVLVVGGGDGMGGIVETASCLGKKLSSDAQSTNNQFQMVVVCGNNQDAKTKLEETVWPEGVNVKINGFVNNMDEWMRACDAIVTKAGPGTIAEASICGLPCMLSSYLPGQEEGNIPFVENAGFGTYSGDPLEISETVSSWLRDEEKLKSMRNAALNAARPFATLCIAQDLAKMLFATKQTKNSAIL